MVKIKKYRFERMVVMDLNRIPVDILRKVEVAAENSFSGNYNGFCRLTEKDLFKIAYIHGFNCSHSMYDAAEERVEGLIKTGEVPEKEIPSLSSNASDKAERYFRENEDIISSGDSKGIYIWGYQKGFEEGFRDFLGKEVNEKSMYDVVNYYLSGKR
jgi:hypothetical protein